MVHHFIPSKYGAGAASLLAKGYIAGAYRKNPSAMYSKKYNTNPKPKSRPAGQGRTATNFQKPTALMYRRRPANRKVKRKARAAQMRFYKNQIKTTGKKSLMFNTVSQHTLSENVASVFSSHLYSGKEGDSSTAPNPQSNISDMGNCFLSLGSGVADQNEKLLFDTATMEINITNNFTTTPVELKIYSVSCKVDTPSDILNTYIQGFKNEDSLSAPFVDYDAADPSATPFDQHLFGSYFTIHKVTKTYLDPGQTTSWVKRDKRNRLVNYSRFVQANPGPLGKVCVKGLTSGYLIVAKPLATPDIGDGQNIRFETIRRYKFAHVQSSTNRMGKADITLPTGTFRRAPQRVDLTNLSIPVNITNECVPVELCNEEEVLPITVQTSQQSQQLINPTIPHTI